MVNSIEEAEAALAAERAKHEALRERVAALADEYRGRREPFGNALRADLCSLLDAEAGDGDA